MNPLAHAPKRAVLNWDDLRITLAIAEHGTLSGAAAHLRISHPTLSRRLRQIERRLGTRLFERTPSSLRPTAAGEEVRQLAVRMREDISALERRIGNRDTAPAGPVRLTAPDAVSEYLLPGILAEICQENAGLTIDLVVSNQVLSLAQRAADIALRITGSPAATLRGRRVGTVAMAIYAARNLPVPEGSATFAGIPWIGFDASLACSGPGAWVARNIAESDIRFRANTLLGAAQAVRSGIGCGMLVGSRVERKDIGKHGGGELRPAAVTGTIERRRRVQRHGGFHLLDIFADDPRLEDNLVAHAQKRHLPQRGYPLKPLRFVGEVDIHPLVSQALLGQLDRGALGVRTKMIADQLEDGHSQAPCRIGARGRP